MEDTNFTPEVIDLKDINDKNFRVNRSRLDKIKEFEVPKGKERPRNLPATEKVEESKTDESSGRNGPKILFKIKFNSAETGEKVPGIQELQIIDQRTRE